MSHFSNDLGLDSLDTVEVVMAIEEVKKFVRTRGVCADGLSQEFSIEIPDKEADAIHSSRFQAPRNKKPRGRSNAFNSRQGR